MDTVVKAGSEVLLKKKSRVEQIDELRRLLDAKNTALLEHEYFTRCRANQISRAELIVIVKQLYCFSVFFERLLARRVAEYSSARDPRIIEIARKHMCEEVGHAQLFRDCLLANGVSSDEIDRLSPAMFTKAMFGYLTVTILHENEYVSNVAIMQVMEGIGYHFFSATLKVMQDQNMLADAMAQHTEDDEEHSTLGLDLAAQFGAATLLDCKRVIEDLYRLMAFVLHEWLGTHRRATSAPPERRRRSTRPPRRAVGST